MRRLAIFLMLLISVVYDSKACYCENPFIDQSFNNSIIVLRGKIIGKEFIKNSQEQDSNSYIIKYSVLINEYFKGRSNIDTVNIYSTNTSCGAWFDVGVNYIIFADKNSLSSTQYKSEYWTGECRFNTGDEEPLYKSVLNEVVKLSSQQK